MGNLIIFPALPSEHVQREPTKNAAGGGAGGRGVSGGAEEGGGGCGAETEGGGGGEEGRGGVGPLALGPSIWASHAGSFLVFSRKPTKRS